MPAQDLPIDAEIPNFPDLISCDYIMAAYTQFMYGADEFKEQDQDFEVLIGRSH
jgi:hypothetical protein